MSEEGEKKYKFFTENSEEKTMSRGYTGQASAYYPNGDIYVGDYADGIREGRGVYTYGSKGENFDKYEGMWVQNLKHGIGKMIYHGKGEYHGYWENGRRHGEGTFEYSNGDVYTGWWRFGEKNGTGHYKFKATGMSLVGEWENGQIKNGSWIYPNGVEFKGSFKDNKPVGEGTWSFRNGNSLKGVFEHKAKGEDDEDDQEEEDPEGGEGAKKAKFDLVWKANAGIAAAAHMVNSVEQ